MRWDGKVSRWNEFDKAAGVYIAGFSMYAKIGWSSRIGKRLREIETGTPEHLSLYIIYPDACRGFEKELHKRFAKYRRQREWFVLGGEFLKYVQTRAIDPVQRVNLPTRQDTKCLPGEENALSSGAP